MKSFQDFRNEISIIDMAISIGFKQDKSKGNKWPVFVNQYNNDKIIIVNPKSSDNQGYFNPNDDTDKGTLINFIKNRLGAEFETDKSISDYINVNNALYKFQNTPLPSQQESYFEKTNNFNKESFAFSTDGLTNTLVNAKYLLNRHIKRDIFDSKLFKGRILNLENKGHSNIAFPFYDKNDKIIGIEKRNFEYKKFVIGSDRSNSVWHSNIPEKLDRIIIAESAIDAISYHQLKPTNNSLYVSIGGSLSLNQIAVITNLKQLSMPTDKFEFVSAVDNDINGLKYDAKLSDWLNPDKLIVDKPITKDYNQDLANANENRFKIKPRITH